jgi:hypothetical protein
MPDQDPRGLVVRGGPADDQSPVKNGSGWVKGALVKILVSVLTALALASAAWAWTTDNRILALEVMAPVTQQKLDSIGKKVDLIYELLVKHMDK